MNKALSPVVPFLKYRLQVSPLTAVHIGTDEVITPCEYDVTLIEEESSRYGVLTVFDLESILGNLNAKQRSEFHAINDAADMRRLRVWLRSRAEREEHQRFRAVMTWEAASELHRSINDLNRSGLIHLQMRNPSDNHPLIPGSSIKGAIRTAVVDRLLRECGSRYNEIRQSAAGQGQRTGARMEGRLMHYGDNLRRDPFRQVCISDAIFEPGTTCIERMISVSAGDGASRNAAENQSSGIQSCREVIMGCAYRGVSPEATAELRLSPVLSNAERLRPRDDRNKGREIDIHVTMPLSAERLIEDCNQFYRDKCLQEHEQFQREITAGFTGPDYLRKAIGRVEALASDQCVIRVGHHSHFDAVTVGDEMRQPPRRFTGRYRWYAGGVLPLGWVILTIRSPTRSDL